MTTDLWVLYNKAQDPNGPKEVHKYLVTLEAETMWAQLVPEDIPYILARGGHSKLTDRPSLAFMIVCEAAQQYLSEQVTT